MAPSTRRSSSAASQSNRLRMARVRTRAIGPVNIKGLAEPVEVLDHGKAAEALEAEGYFFSSAGGSPVSCQIGMAVLERLTVDDVLASRLVAVSVLALA